MTKVIEAAARHTEKAREVAHAPQLVLSTVKAAHITALSARGGE